MIQMISKKKNQKKKKMRKKIKKRRKKKSKKKKKTIKNILPSMSTLSYLHFLNTSIMKKNQNIKNL